jgi:hypothetical protein
MRGYSRYVDPKWEAKLSELVKLKRGFDTMKEENNKVDAKL